MNSLTRFGPWITGIALCFCGVLLVRIPVGAENSWLFSTLGHLLAGGGLLRIALGVRRRIEDCEEEP